MGKWVYVLAALAFGVKMVVLVHPTPESPLAIVAQVVTDSGIPNAVSAIILRNRLYDTVCEVIVFTIAIMGVQGIMADERPLSRIYQLTDAPSVVLAQLGATIAALVGVELALRGHLTPGGGFAAGVAGGTAIGLIAMTSPPELLQSIYQRWHISTWEKLTVMVFIILSVLTLIGWEPPQGKLGALVSGGMIPVLNMLVAVKVTLGSWAMVLVFIRYRGLL
ncbi:putative monovalent cation/H+ antiporter subunit B [Gloeomargarita lithophora Alchichica-D10]|uniref:Putative monovalent cation/H+ antiporter subunit B n=1 Tax=Gloeomargarita lithophora Alchichica-D10 TaxID=1188229 RepID=A0A1J0A9B0_9CYAN|nr:Na(+)/H(+) antiporter subunit B [Gloeomargarita lithophora]APB32516.1 putative monovalent cation/H+ antiporter subunit B [Gloeomargarita lithophora Alchichica-D10]